MTANQDAPSITLLPVVPAESEQTDAADVKPASSAGGCCGGACHG